MLTNEDLLMISELFDVKFEAQNRIIDDKLAQQNEELKKEIRQTKLELRREMQDMEGGLCKEIQDIRTELQDVKNETGNIRLLFENDIQPRLSTIESCYVDTAERYYKGAAEIESMKHDMDILKKVAKEHSEKLRKIQ